MSAVLSIQNKTTTRSFSILHFALKCLTFCVEWLFHWKRDGDMILVYIMCIVLYWITTNGTFTREKYKRATKEKTRFFCLFTKTAWQLVFGEFYNLSKKNTHTQTHRNEIGQPIINFVQLKTGSKFTRIEKSPFWDSPTEFALKFVRSTINRYAR